MKAAAVVGATHTLRTRVDGSLTISIEIEPRDAKAAFDLFGVPGTPIALAMLTPQAAQQAATDRMIAEAEAELSEDDGNSLEGLSGEELAQVMGSMSGVTDAMRGRTSPPKKGPHGLHYSILYRMGFWFNPSVSEAFSVSHVPVEDRIEYIKAKMCSDLAVDSLSFVHPDTFIQYCRNLGIATHIPAAFKEAK